MKRIITYRVGLFAATLALASTAAAAPNAQCDQRAERIQQQMQRANPDRQIRVQLEELMRDATADRANCQRYLAGAENILGRTSRNSGDIDCSERRRTIERRMQRQDFGPRVRSQVEELLADAEAEPERCGTYLAGAEGLLLGSVNRAGDATPPSRGGAEDLDCRQRVAGVEALLQRSDPDQQVRSQVQELLRDAEANPDRCATYVAGAESLLRERGDVGLRCEQAIDRLEQRLQRAQPGEQVRAQVEELIRDAEANPSKCATYIAAAQSMLAQEGAGYSATPRGGEGRTGENRSAGAAATACEARVQRLETRVRRQDPDQQVRSQVDELMRDARANPRRCETYLAGAEAVLEQRRRSGGYERWSDRARTAGYGCEQRIQRIEERMQRRDRVDQTQAQVRALVRDAEANPRVCDTYLQAAEALLQRDNGVTRRRQQDSASTSCDREAERVERNLRETQPGQQLRAQIEELLGDARANPGMCRAYLAGADAILAQRRGSLAEEACDQRASGVEQELREVEPGQQLRSQVEELVRDARANPQWCGAYLAGARAILDHRTDR